MHEPGHEHRSQTIEFTRETKGLPDARPTQLVELADGDEFELEIVPVKKQIGDATVRMLAYNGSVPGPTLKVPQGATITVHVTNHGDIDGTVHWHGLRLENRYDGTHDTQAPIPVGESFTYQVHVPDPGAFWYHPHIREDYGQEMGLYGNILSTPSEPDYWQPANRELLLTLDDILIEDGQIAAFSASETTHVAMGRFGNVMLVAGEPDLALEAKRGEVVRFYFTNTANTRVFNVTLPGAQMKLVGADAGHYEREERVDEVLLAPSERVVVDVLFPDSGELELQHETPEHTYRLASITVVDQQPEQSFADEFAYLRSRDATVLRERIEPFLEAPPDKTLSFTAEMDMGVPEGVPVVYVCPMHPEVVSEEPGSCPKCGMKLLAQAAEETTYVCPMHPEVTSDKPDRCPKCGMKLCRQAWSQLEVNTATSTTTAMVRKATATSMKAITSTDITAMAKAKQTRSTASTDTTATAPKDTADTEATPSTARSSTVTTPRRGSNGKTTWSRSTGRQRPRTCAGSSSTATRAPRTRRSIGRSMSATR